MANRKTCLVCRGRNRAEDLHWLPKIHRALCPEHKRLRNRMLRHVVAHERKRDAFIASFKPRAAGEGDT